MFEVMCFVKKFKGNLKHNFAIPEVQEVTMTYILKFLIHLSFKRAYLTWELSCISICLQKFKNWKILTALEKRLNWFYWKTRFTRLKRSVQVGAVIGLNIACKWWGRIRQKYYLYFIVIFTLAQLCSVVINLLTKFIKSCKIVCDGPLLSCFKTCLTCPIAILVANGWMSEWMNK
jgi:hypothetical protein